MHDRETSRSPSGAGIGLSGGEAPGSNRTARIVAWRGGLPSIVAEGVRHATLLPTGASACKERASEGDGDELGVVGVGVKEDNEGSSHCDKEYPFGVHLAPSPGRCHRGTRAPLLPMHRS